MQRHGRDSACPAVVEHSWLNLLACLFISVRMGFYFHLLKKRLIPAVRFKGSRSLLDMCFVLGLKQRDVYQHRFVVIDPPRRSQGTIAVGLRKKNQTQTTQVLKHQDVFILDDLQSVLCKSGARRSPAAGFGRVWRVWRVSLRAPRT